jgi:hypothetical protein
MITIKKLTTVILLAIMTSSCVIKPLTDIQPDWTSYPADKVVEEKVSMLITPSISSTSYLKVLPKSDGSSVYSSSSESIDSVTYDSKQTIVGDTATHEIYILPEGRSLASEKELSRQVPAKGHEICGDKYAIYDSKYYFGSEATLGMHGISTPALKIAYRCPVYDDSSKTEQDKYIRNLAKKLPNHIYFDSMVTSFQVNVDTLNHAVLKVIEAEDIRVISYAIDKSINYLYASKNESYGKKYRILDIVITSERQGEGSVLKFIYMPYTRLEHKRGVLGTEKPSTLIGVTPSNRKYSYRKSLLFLSKIDKYLQSGETN